ncbi:ankyrin-related protein [Cryptosporidium ubiquitum]|uniref:Ankyrin-related protein n=1 Tax=Cryptosporidium ubiquitum TaxID=857276 RepID=A0A1J4MGM2_9CRYT|nr:ankyrin-related protein [Cryptosporidium ubiquitum]OII73377.1 ankyrin-related protein [Cryptosporidium ubiquitum]
MDNQQLELENTNYSESSSNTKALASLKGSLPEDCYYSADEDFQLENEEVVNTSLVAPSGRFSNSNRSSGLKTLGNNSQNFKQENGRSQKISLSGLENRFQDNIKGKGRVFGNVYQLEKTGIDEYTCQACELDTNSSLSVLSSSEDNISEFSVLSDTDIFSLPVEKQNSLILKASKIGNLQLVRQLIASSKLNANATNEKGFSSLHWASLKGHSQVVEELLNADADPNSKNIMLCTPLHFSANNGFDEIVSKLLKAGADPNSVSALGHTPIFSAAFMGHENTVKTLLKSGADPNHKNKQGLTPKGAAESQGYSDIVKILEGACMH